MSKQKYSANDAPKLIDDICYQLAFFKYLHERTKKLDLWAKESDYYKKIVACIATHLMKSANLKLNGNNSPKKQNETYEFIETLAQKDIMAIATSQENAEQAVKDFVLPFHDFEVHISNKKNGEVDKFNVCDSYGDEDLLAKYGQSFYDILNNGRFLGGVFRPVQSHLPLIENLTVKTNPNEKPIELLYSNKRPPNGTFVHHKIWITPHIYIQTKFKTDKSLSEYMEDHPMEERELIQLIHHVNEMNKNMDKSLKINEQRDYLTEQFYKLQVDTAIRRHQRLSEIYIVLAVEYLNDLAKLTNPNSNSNFTSQYTPLRDSLSHTSEMPINPVSYLPGFEKGLVTELSQVSGMSEADINKKINQYMKVFESNQNNTTQTNNKNQGNTQTKHISLTEKNSELIRLLDEQKILKNTLMQVLQQKIKGSVFVVTGLINANEDKVLNLAWDERNKLCHGENVSISVDLKEYLRILNKIYRGIYEKILPSINPQSNSQGTFQVINNQTNQPAYVHPFIISAVGEVIKQKTNVATTTSSGSTSSQNLTSVNFPFLREIGQRLNSTSLSDEEFQNIVTASFSSQKDNEKMINKFYSLSVSYNAIKDTVDLSKANLDIQKTGTLSLSLSNIINDFNKSNYTVENQPSLTETYAVLKSELVPLKKDMLEMMVKKNSFSKILKKSNEKE